MCKLLIAIKDKGLSKKDNESFRDVLLAQFDDLDKEKDGCGGIVMTHDNKFHSSRSLENYEQVYRDISKHVDEARLIALHTRTKTSGERNLANVHFFESGDWTFAHNGWVQEYMGYNYRDTEYNRYYGNQAGYKDTNDNKDIKRRHFDDGVWENCKDYACTQESRGMAHMFDYADEVNWDEDGYIRSTLTDCPDCKLAFETSKEATCTEHEDLAKTIKKADELGYDLAYSEDGIVVFVAKDEPVKEDKKVIPRKEEKKEGKEDKNKTGGMCDSYQFLDNLVTPSRPITKEVINAEVKRTRFSGMGLLVNRMTGEAFVIVRKATYALQPESNKFGYFFSYDPTTDITKQKVDKLYGITTVIDGEVEEIPVIKKDIVEGTYELEVNKNDK